MKERCPQSKILKVGYLDGYKLGFTHYSRVTWGGGVADVLKEPGSKVWGVIYELPEDDLERLDVHEGRHNDIYNRFKVM